MGLRGDLQSIVQNVILNGLSDIPRTFTFVQKVPGTYNPTTGSTGITEVELNVTGVLVGFNSYEAGQWNVLETAQKALIPALQFGSVSPDALEDQCEVSGKRYKVLKFKKDPADALVTFALLAVED